ncbi:TetR/AcrR family transcriptional regulator [Streptomyces sp. NBC_01003]|uniref:TetR/AcrR family transcriptional regulator n=1 Tax=Streptomyces sp. NBC_01003 TaxID=2903714 RepID=UPI00386C89DF
MRSLHRQVKNDGLIRIVALIDGHADARHAGTDSNPVLPQTRQALVRAARQILAESGGSKASVHAVAERADGGIRSVYNHFTGKSGLFDAAVADALEE